MNYLLIGRPNVGKSSLYNILSGTNKNIIHKVEGTTRDWHKSEIIKNSNNFVYDTPGFLIENKKNKPSNLLLNLIKEIDIFLFVVDFRSLYNLNDHQIIKWLRKYEKKIILIINKYDNSKLQIQEDHFKYGIKEFFFVSCTHKIGINELEQYIKKFTIKNNKIINEKIDFSIGIFGKPNAGKSTFLNTLLGFERSFTSKIEGTTSDYVIEDANINKKKIRIIDTAGISRKSKINKSSISSYSINKTLSNLKFVDVSLILIDASKGFDRQDKRIINLILDKSKNIIIIFNKKDLIKNLNLFKKNITQDLESSLFQVKNIKLFFVTAFSKSQVNKIFTYINNEIFDKKYNITTSQLNQWLKMATNLKNHPLINKKKINFKYAVKLKNSPITIKIFCNFPKNINQSYIRYLKNNFNKKFKIINQNIKFYFSKSQNPFEKN